jgi:hypothetical protein
MEAIAAPVVDHLMLKGAYLALISTLPTGPMQGERLIYQQRLTGQHSYRPIDDQGFNNYVNLGFIPGGQAGLLSFVEIPQQAIPLNLDNYPVWKGGPLESVSRLSDFKLVVVITENPDIARDWIEQVQPRLGATPLIMLISAQAEPVVRPYYSAGGNQVQGLITGLSGAAGYEFANGRRHLALDYWSPYSLGILIAIVLIIIGGGINLTSTLIALTRETVSNRKKIDQKTTSRKTGGTGKPKPVQGQKEGRPR